MKIAVTGKGGVGKTTISGMLARLLAAEGHRVLAIDADPDANLASALGISEAEFRKITPIAKMKEEAEKRTEASGSGSYFILNPKVDDLPEKYCLEHAGVRLLSMGTVEQGGTGCVCPEHTLVRRLMKHLLIERDDVVIMDMEAGIEHLGRGTAESVDALIIVVEPGRRSVQTAEQIKRLAGDIGIKNTFVVGSKIRDEADGRFITGALQDIELLGLVSLSDVVREADLKGVSPFDIGGDVVDEIRSIKDTLFAKVAGAS
ncbi:CO dehydrogenase maturation factor [Geothermobacter ehrlichii]|uniref:CO dehydrogenase maturation factor n=1 Tax=Geothermobacter ehrlichii TaxID=213224 RepID=A0A5D3WI57_9BACT|nr:carbon monoxide dehydrogenase accessory protein CooC [Geothermobacter ehrlichii]TYO98565.1 CO dehydrogenase maturation factor [Geothermobacter ehrlichii]